MSELKNAGDIDFASIHVLTIDDAPFMLKMIGRSLELVGVAHVLTAENGVKGLEVLDENEGINLIICDLDMPEMNGFDFVRNLRFKSSKENSKIPVIILTGHGEIENFHDSIDLGISGFVEKPITVDILKQHIVNALTSDFIQPPVF